MLENIVEDCKDIFCKIYRKAGDYCRDKGMFGLAEMFYRKVGIMRVIMSLPDEIYHSRPDLRYKMAMFTAQGTDGGYDLFDPREDFYYFDREALRYIQETLARKEGFKTRYEKSIEKYLKKQLKKLSNWQGKG